MTFIYALILITLFIIVPIGSFFLVRHIFRQEAAAGAADAAAAAALTEAALSLDKTA